MTKILDVPLDLNNLENKGLENMVIVFDFCQKTIKENTEQYNKSDIKKLQELKLLIALYQQHPKEYKDFLTTTLKIDNEDINDIKKTNLIITLASIIINSNLELEDLSLDNLVLLTEFLIPFNSKEYKDKVRIFGNNTVLDCIRTKTEEKSEQLEILEYFNATLSNTVAFKIKAANGYEEQYIKSVTGMLMSVLKHTTIEELKKIIEQNKVGKENETRRI